MLITVTLMLFIMHFDVINRKRSSCYLINMIQYYDHSFVSLKEVDARFADVTTLWPWIFNSISLVIFHVDFNS